jgi:hypothetical protein
VGLTTPHGKNKLVTKILKKPRAWTDSLDSVKSGLNNYLVLITVYQLETAEEPQSVQCCVLKFIQTMDNVEHTCWVTNQPLSYASTLESHHYCPVIRHCDVDE